MLFKWYPSARQGKSAQRLLLKLQWGGKSFQNTAWFGEMRSYHGSHIEHRFPSRTLSAPGLHTMVPSPSTTT